jgi:hypothetical protein
LSEIGVTEAGWHGVFFYCNLLACMELHTYLGILSLRGFWMVDPSYYGGSPF